MTVLSAQNLSKSYGDRLLFSDVTFGMTRDDRVGLIGVNGSGKSTLLRILVGEETPDDGEVIEANDARIEYLAQRPQLDEAKTPLETVLSEGPEEFEVVRRYERACRQLSENPADQSLSERVAELSEQMDVIDGWDLETDAKTMLSRLGIEELSRPVGSMSGGQQKRVALARALIRPADLLILDEPTNHLDIETIAWLEGYLANRTAGLLLITHDRYFLDRVTNVIFELDDQTVYRHQGNYGDFIEARQKRRELQRKREQKRKQLAKKELAWLRRGPKARGTKAKARKQRAEELLETSFAVEEKSVEIDAAQRRLGKKIINLDQVGIRRNREPILESFTYRVDRNDRLGIVGPNGVGKSTLLDIIAGRLEPEEGTVERGQTVAIGYYDQTTDELDPSMRVHDYITEVANRVPTSDGWMTASQMLELFLFDKKKQWTYIEKLSGGERRRLYLLRILMGRPNVLLLDEPTNDLDVDTLAVLEDYLDDFDGAVISVSHDRYFLDRTVDHLLVFQGEGTVEEVPGNYSYWEERLKEQRRRQREEERTRQNEEKQRRQEKRAREESKGLTYRQKQELKQLEERIDEIEARLAAIDEEMVEKATDYEAVAALDEEKAALNDELEEAMVRWTELSEMAE